MYSRSFITESEKRKRQIDTLKIFNDHVIEVKESVEYKVEFMAGETKMTLNVVLSPEFPNEKPHLMIDPVVVHPWIQENSNQIVGAPGLLNYTVHSDLGRVVQAVIREFQRAPPPLVHSILYHKPTARDVNQYAYNAVRTSSPELDNLTSEELQLMLDNDDQLDKFVETLPQSIQMEKSVNDLMDQIQELADTNLARQKDLEEMKSGITERINTINKLRNNYENLNSKHNKLSQAYSPHTIMESLKALAVEADKEAEDLASKFLEGDIDPDTFVKSYKEKRGMSQLRRARQERLSHQLAELNKAQKF